MGITPVWNISDKASQFLGVLQSKIRIKQRQTINQTETFDLILSELTNCKNDLIKETLEECEIK